MRAVSCAIHVSQVVEGAVHDQGSYRRLLGDGQESGHAAHAVAQDADAPRRYAPVHEKVVSTENVPSLQIPGGHLVAV